MPIIKRNQMYSTLLYPLQQQKITSEAKNIVYQLLSTFLWNACLSCPLTNPLLSSCFFSSSLGTGSLCDDSRHAEPREALLWWDCTKCDTVGLGLLCFTVPACLAISPPAVFSCNITRALLMRGSAVPQRGGLSSSPTHNDPKVCRLGWEEDSVRTRAFWCCFFFLNIQIPPSFFPSLRLETSLLLINGLDFAWNCFHILFW